MRSLLAGILLISIFLFGCNKNETSQTTPQIRKLIQENTAVSLIEAATIYQYGEGVKRNIVEAARLHYLAAQKGNYHSHYQIWRLWDEFSKTKLDPPFDLTQFHESGKEAIAGYTRLLLKHPDIDDPELYYRLGILYDPGIGIINQEGKTAEAFIKKAAEMGHEEAKRLLQYYNVSSTQDLQQFNETLLDWPANKIDSPITHMSLIPK